MIIFPGLIGSIARAGKTVVVPPAPLTYTAAVSSPLIIDNRSFAGGTPPISTRTTSFTVNATGTGTETLTINLIDYSSGRIKASFNPIINFFDSPLLSRSVTGGSVITVYVAFYEDGGSFVVQSADLYMNGSGGNSSTPNPIIIQAYPYNSF